MATAELQHKAGHPLRLGTPALASLGLGPAEMDEIADIITTTLSATKTAYGSSGSSKARYVLDGAVAEAGRRARPSC